MSNPLTLTIGPFVVGEVPEPFTYQFLDSAGTALDLTGFTAEFHLSIGGADADVLAADVSDPDAGEVTYTWVDGDLDTTGRIRAYFWVDNGTNRFASLKIHGQVSRNV